MSTTHRQRLCAALFAAIALTLPTGYASAQPAEEDPGEDAEYSDSLQPAPDAAGDLAAAEPSPVVETSTVPAKDEGKAGEAGYDKGFYIKSADGKFSLKTQGRVQGRYSFQMDKGADGHELAGSNFQVTRARLTLGGNAYGKAIKYKFQTDFGKGFATLKDFYVDYQLSDAAMIRLGQYKVPFSRQQLTSSSRLELMDRAITDKYFKAGRDIGITIQNNIEKSPDLEWAVGVFNGTSDKPLFKPRTTTNPDTGVTTVTGGDFTNVPGLFGPALVARVGINRGGINGYSEADLEGGPLRFGVGASVLAELDTDDNDKSAARAQLDFIVKASGLSSTGGVYIATAQDGTAFSEQAYDALGFHVQLGYMLAKEHQAVTRFAMISADDTAKNQQELAVGYSLYKFGHNFKWQTDVSLQGSGGEGTIGDVVVAKSELQLSF